MHVMEGAPPTNSSEPHQFTFMAHAVGIDIVPYFTQLVAGIWESMRDMSYMGCAASL